jgi:hypothetical protein
VRAPARPETHTQAKKAVRLACASAIVRKRRSQGSIRRVVAALGVSKTISGLDQLTLAFRSHSRWGVAAPFAPLRSAKTGLSGLVNDSSGIHFCAQTGAPAPKSQDQQNAIEAESCICAHPNATATSSRLCRKIDDCPTVGWGRRGTYLIPPLISAYFEMMSDRNTPRNQLLPNRPPGVDIHATPCKPQGSRCSKGRRSICLRARQDGSSNPLCIGLAPAFVFRQQRTRG